MSGASPSGLLVATHELCWAHDPGHGHPERADRLTAVRQGIIEAGVGDGVDWIEATEAAADDVHAVHPPALLRQLDELCRRGGGAIDPDTWVSAQSNQAAWRAAGAGLDLIERLDRGEAAVGWSVVRPPGHHATSDTQMGFCLINNVAVAARSLTRRGHRVAVVDIDAHHGNGTQAVFYDDPDVLYVSFHQYPWYPYTGAIDEVGEGAGRGSTLNVPLPSGTTVDTYRTALDEVVGPVLARFEPDWLLLSLGFDAHRADPLTDLGLTVADFADLVDELMAVVPAGRRLVFLEGGYDLDALRAGAGAVAATLLGERHRPEAPSSAADDLAVGTDELVARLRRLHLDGALGPDREHPGA